MMEMNLEDKEDASPVHKKKGGILKSSKGDKKAGIIWDEENLFLNELEKVPRMKIDEPKTPYVAPMDYMEESIDVVEVHSLESEISISHYHHNSLAVDVASVPAIVCNHCNEPEIEFSDEAMQKIASAALTRRNNEWSSTSAENDSDEQDLLNLHGGMDKQSTRDFADKRKRHYNEFKVVRKLSAKELAELDED